VDRGVGVTDVRGVVRVVDGRRHVEGCRHAPYSTDGPGDSESLSRGSHRWRAAWRARSTSSVVW
jgi:hypothetical protein